MYLYEIDFFFVFWNFYGMVVKENFRIEVFVFFIVMLEFFYLVFFINFKCFFFLLDI